MQIKEIHIYGFGKLEDTLIKGLSEFQVFFGENEAGKSTIMAFIHGILFGFPTKQQSAELRYEPKNSAKYGGKLIIEHEDYGICVIERVKGKAAGDVTITLPDGVSGGEELLKQLMYRFDKGLYQAVFSFNMHGLQNIHQMKGEEVGKFLFSAGTLGTDRLAQTETLLQKELESRFKPGGKKPLLNEKLQALHELNQKLKKAAAHSQEITGLFNRKADVQEKIAETRQALNSLNEDIGKLGEWKKINSFVLEEQWIKQELEALGEIQFPAGGLERIEKLEQLLHPLNAQISGLNNRISEMEKDLETLQLNFPLLESEEMITSILEQTQVYDRLKTEKEKYEWELRELEEKLSLIKDKLHLPIDNNQILQINTNIHMKDKIAAAARKSQRLEEIKLQLEDRFQEEKQALETLENQVQAAKAQVWPAETRRLIQQRLAEGNNKQNLEAEQIAIRDKINFYQETIDKQYKQQKQKHFQFSALAFLLLALSLYGFITSQWLLLILGIGGLIFLGIAVLMGVKNKDDKPSKTIALLKEREIQLANQLQSQDFREMSELKEQFERDGRYREQLQALEIKLEQQQMQYEKVIFKFEEWERESSRHKELLASISKELNLPADMVQSHLSEAFILLEQFKALERERRHMTERLALNQHDSKDILRRINEYGKQFLPDSGMDLHRTAYLLKSALKREHEKQIKLHEMEMKLGELKADFQQKKQEQKHLETEIHRLLSESAADDVRAFYELGEKAGKKTKLEDRLADLRLSLQNSLLSEEERNAFLQIQQLEALLSEKNEEGRCLQEQLQQHQDNLAALNYEIQVLEEGGAYSELLHQFKQQQFEFEKSAKEWAAFRLAREILKQTIDKFKNVHLPKLLSRAEKYLSFLTDGRYPKIHLNPSGSGFLIEREDLAVFEANELSQATTEQVYVSIRFALATTLYENYRLPIIIDDSFVNFDEKRTQKVMELIKTLKGNQILFFTCHKHLLHQFRTEQIIMMEKDALKISS